MGKIIKIKGADFSTIALAQAYTKDDFEFILSDNSGTPYARPIGTATRAKYIFKTTRPCSVSYTHADGRASLATYASKEGCYVTNSSPYSSSQRYGYVEKSEPYGWIAEASGTFTQFINGQIWVCVSVKVKADGTAFTQAELDASIAGLEISLEYTD